MRKYIQKSVFLLIFAQLFMLFGCTNQKINSSFYDQEISTLTIISTKTKAPTSTASPEVTKTITPMPIPIDREKLVEAYLMLNDSCELPCFFGITPGTSNWEEVKMDLSELGFEWGKPFDPYDGSDGNRKIYYTQMRSSVSPFILVISPLIDNDTIDALLIQLAGSGVSEYIPEYSIPGLLKSLGIPSRVWMDSDYHTGLPRPVFAFWIFYDQLGIVLRYYVIGSLNNDAIIICPNDPNRFEDDATNKLYGLNMYMQSPENIRLLENLVNVWGEKIPNLPLPINEISGKSLEEASEFTMKDFYNVFVDVSSPECFETPKGLWNEK
jgi:hypothetical protein